MVVLQTPRSHHQQQKPQQQQRRQKPKQRQQQKRTKAVLPFPTESEQPTKNKVTFDKPVIQKVGKLLRKLSLVSACHTPATSQSRPSLTSSMADDKTSPEVAAQEDLIHDPSVSLARPKRKLDASGSKPWFNKSLDQSSLQRKIKPTSPRLTRRQNSVTDFFQNMLSKSKSHIQDIFTSKKDKAIFKLRTRKGSPEGHPLKPDLSLCVGGAAGVQDSQPESLFFRDTKSSSHRNSCPSFCDSVEQLPPPLTANGNPKVKGDNTTSFNNTKLGTSSNLSTPLNMFVVGELKVDDVGVEFPSQYRPIVKKSSLPFPPSGHHVTPLKCKSPLPASFLSPRRKMSGQTLSAPGKYHHPKIVALSWDESSDGVEEVSQDRREISSAPPSRQSGSLMVTQDGVNRAKRSLIKSNSETFTKLCSSPQPLAKASSDGNCFKNGLATSSLTNSMSALGNIMISVTDYLFLGSIEAAYNEPLLCKYSISSLIDMSNVSPTLVPANKKCDCPCPCANKTHFRSKLNIGVDDIEWENLEQYFEEINAFINGARKNDRRVLVFSYNGQSRAAAAVIQHLMQHFKMTYREAMSIVRAKRPQIKLNSGFVKALCRLEKRLRLDDIERRAELEKPNMNSGESPLVLCSSVESMDMLSAPPVVRGAWLEC